MIRFVLAHREWRPRLGGSHHFAVFEEIWPGMCWYSDCGKSGEHPHERSTGDLTAAELLTLDENAFNAAFEDLHHYDAVTYYDIVTARLELLRERDEDEERAPDDRGRRVA